MPPKTKVTKFRGSTAAYAESGLSSEDPEQIIHSRKSTARKSTPRRSTPRKSPTPASSSKKSTSKAQSQRVGRPPKNTAPKDNSTPIRKQLNHTPRKGRSHPSSQPQGHVPQATPTPGKSRSKSTTPKPGRRSRSASTPGSSKRSTPEKLALQNFILDEDGQRVSISTYTNDSPLKTAVTPAERHEIGIDLAIQGDERASADDPEYASWTEAERDLFNNFADRGAVPMLPSSWKLDFSTMPDQLFTDDDKEAFINTYSGKDFAAIKALNSLLLVGTRVRDRLVAGHDPSTSLQRAVTAYYKWCLQDGHLENTHFKPLFCSTGTRAGETTGDAVSRISSEFQTLAAGHRRGRDRSHAYDDARSRRAALPTLYGVIVAQSVLAVVTYDAGKHPGTVNTIALFDFADDSQDVWNAFAVAILLVTVRNCLVGTGETDELGMDYQDPDA